MDKEEALNQALLPLLRAPAPTEDDDEVSPWKVFRISLAGVKGYEKYKGHIGGFWFISGHSTAKIQTPSDRAALRRLQREWPDAEITEVPQGTPTTPRQTNRSGMVMREPKSIGQAEAQAEKKVKIDVPPPVPKKEEEAPIGPTAPSGPVGPIGPR